MPPISLYCNRTFGRWRLPSSMTSSVPTGGSSLYVSWRPASYPAGRTPDEVYATAGKQGEIGGVIEPRIHLSQAAILSRQAGPNEPQGEMAPGSLLSSFLN